MNVFTIITIILTVFIYYLLFGGWAYWKKRVDYELKNNPRWKFVFEVMTDAF